MSASGDSQGEAVFAGGLTLIGLYCATRAVIQAVDDGFDLHSLIAPVVVTVGTVIVFLVLRAQAGRPEHAGRAPRGRTLGGAACVHGTGTKEATKVDLIKHENGHKRLLNKYGVGTALFGQRVWSPKPGVWQGYTIPASWSRFDKLPIVKQIAIYAAGGIAMGSRTHDVSDNANIQTLLTQVPHKDRAAIEAEGRAQARKDL